MPIQRAPATNLPGAACQAGAAAPLAPRPWHPASGAEILFGGPASSIAGTIGFASGACVDADVGSTDSSMLASAILRDTLSRTAPCQTACQ